MIFNKICPYCSIEMIKAENLPNCQSVEHLVPNTVLTKRRHNGEGDFYACRKCNSKKGAIDEVFGLIAKSQASDPELASKALIRAFTKRENVPQRYWDMYDSAELKEGLVHAKMPILGRELLDYATYFGKGLYFLKYGKVFNDKTDLLHIQFFNKEFHASHANIYQDQFSSNPIKDLEHNYYSQVVAEDQCVIWSKNRSNLIIFHHFISFVIKFKRRNKKTLSKQLELENYIIENFV